MMVVVVLVVTLAGEFHYDALSQTLSPNRRCTNTHDSDDPFWLPLSDNHDDGEKIRAPAFALTGSALFSSHVSSDLLRVV